MKNFELVQVKYIVTRNHRKEVLCRLGQNKYFVSKENMGGCQPRMYSSVNNAISFLRRAGFEIDDTFDFIQVCSRMNEIRAVSGA